MSYPETRVYDQFLAAKSTGAATPLNLAATAAQWVGYAVCGPIVAVRIAFFVTTTITAGTTAPKVAIIRRPTYGSSSGAITLGTMTIPTATAAGKVLYLDIAQTKMSSGVNVNLVNCGEELSFESIVQAVDGGTAAGACFLRIQYDPVVDQVGDQTNAILGTA